MFVVIVQYLLLCMCVSSARTLKYPSAMQISKRSGCPACIVLRRMPAYAVRVLLNKNGVRYTTHCG